MITVSAIVPATDCRDTLDGCRAALLGGSSAPDELILVQEPTDASPARARNLGARRATGDVLLFVDSDVEVSPDAVTRIRTAFEREPLLVALFGSYDEAPSAPGVVSAFRNLLHHHVHQTASGPATTFWTGLGAVRKEAFERVGGFDESIAFMEDVDFGMRLAATGAKIELDGRIQGTHLKSWSFWGMVTTDFSGRGVPWVMLLLRHRGSTRVLNLGWRHRLSAVAALGGAGAILSRRPRAGALAGASLVALNRPFYTLLLRRRGPAEAAAGVFLHALHHVVGVAAVPVGVLRHLLDQRPRRRR